MSRHGPSRNLRNTSHFWLLRSGCKVRLCIRHGGLAAYKKRVCRPWLTKRPARVTSKEGHVKCPPTPSSRKPRQQARDGKRSTHGTTAVQQNLHDVSHSAAVDLLSDVAGCIPRGLGGLARPRSRQIQAANKTRRTPPSPHSLHRCGCMGMYA